MTIGFDQPLYILPFDHRDSFETKMFGWEGALSAEQTAQVAAAKQVIYDGFKAAVAGGVPKEHAGILVDEQFGAAILRDAAARATSPRAPPRRADRKNSTFEYGEEFARHIEAFKPTFCKVLVRYNPEGDAATEPPAGGAAEAAVRLSARQRTGCSCSSCSCPPSPAQLERVARRQKGLRSGTASRADGAGHPRTSGRGRRAGRLEDRGARPSRGLRRTSSRPRGAAAGTASAASSWAAARTTRRSASGSRRRPACRGSSVSPWAARPSGTRWSIGGRTESRARRP